MRRSTCVGIRTSPSTSATPLLASNRSYDRSGPPLHTCKQRRLLPAFDSSSQAENAAVISAASSCPLQGLLQRCIVVVTKPDRTPLERFIFEFDALWTRQPGASAAQAT